VFADCGRSWTHKRDTRLSLPPHQLVIRRRGAPAARREAPAAAQEEDGAADVRWHEHSQGCRPSPSSAAQHLLESAAAPPQREVNEKVGLRHRRSRHPTLLTRLTGRQATNEVPAAGVRNVWMRCAISCQNSDWKTRWLASVKLNARRWQSKRKLGVDVAQREDIALAGQPGRGGLTRKRAEGTIPGGAAVARELSGGGKGDRGAERQN
jgi:hypothetical protein